MHGPAAATIGLVTVGKAHQDTMHALRRLGLAGHPNIAVFKVAMAWPLEPVGLAEFARGKRMLLVVEEKRSLVEMQVRDRLYAWAERPAVYGKADAAGAELLPGTLALSPEQLIAAL